MKGEATATTFQKPPAIREKKPAQIVGGGKPQTTGGGHR